MKPLALFCCLVMAGSMTVHAESELRNDRYDLHVQGDGSVMIETPHAPAQRFVAEFTILRSDADPDCKRDPGHPNYAVAPRTAVRWRNPSESLDDLNAWVSSPEFRSATGLSGTVQDAGKSRIWEFRDAANQVKLRVTGNRAFDTTRPFSVGQRDVLRPNRTEVDARSVHWEYPPQPGYTLAAKLEPPEHEADPIITFTLTPNRAAYYSVAFTGAPDVPLAETLPVPQECAARGHKQFDFVVSEEDLHLPRAHVATSAVNIALAADPRECRFRLPTIADSRFGFMLASGRGRLKPVLIAPLLGGAESQMSAGVPWQFSFRCVVRAGDWKETYRHIASDIQGFRDERDNSGPGSLNATLERVVDFLADRHGGNHAMWDSQQKYYDYFTDKTGVYKPFSPLYGLSAAIITDDEDFFQTRALPAVEYGLSRKTSVFAPYDTADNKQANSAGREVGAPWLSYVQLVTLDRLFQHRTPAFEALARSKAPTTERLADALARWWLTHDAQALAEARALGRKIADRNPDFSEEEFLDLLDLANATRDPRDISTAEEAAYHNAAKMNLYPVPPEASVTVDRGGHVPVHFHSFGRHHNIWGFPPPQPLATTEQTVPAWRIARIGLPGIAYPIEYWMNTHGAMMRTAGLAHDPFLRNVARWGMVGRFGNYPGDNRSQDSLVPELPDAVDRPPWDWNFATVNPGHAWDFAGAVLDFIVSDGFERSGGAVDFPSLSSAGSNFRVGIYGAAAGRFYGDENVRLWLPRGLITSDNRQLDWIAGYGNGQFYLALWNQSFEEQNARIVIDPTRVQCDSTRQARVWIDNAPAPARQIESNPWTVKLSAKGIVAFAIPARVTPGLQAKLYDEALPALPAPGIIETEAPFGKVHALLLRAGRGLTTAYVYTEALPENVIAARLRWRQGDGPWQQMTDDIYPYEFSPELRDDAGDFVAVLEVEDAQQNTLRSPAMTLPLNKSSGPPDTAPTPDGGPISLAKVSPPTNDLPSNLVSDDFITYIEAAANGNEFGRRADGRFYPYSTPQGRRIGWRQVVWDDALFANGCSRETAEEQLRLELRRTLGDLKGALAARRPAVDFDTLDRRQQETLLDFAHSEGVNGVREEFISAVLAAHWQSLVQNHWYVRYTGHVPDHARNKAFAQRWGIP
ncbi:MAG TPA: hypothetical protein VGM54_19025 [Chthoniobacter sp.]|jgi:hypothetical protein